MIASPATLAAELCWRWTCWLALAMLWFFALGSYLHSLPVSNKDLFGMSGVIPALFWPAVRHIFSGSGAQAARTFAVVVFSSMLLWSAAATMGRGMTLPTLLGRARPNLIRSLGIQILGALLRITTLLALACCALGALAVSRQGHDYSGEKFWLVFVPTALLVAFVAGWLKWNLELAEAACVSQSRPVAEALLFAPKAASRARVQFAWVAMVFNALRLLLFFCAAWALSLVVALARTLPASALWAMLLVFAAIYSVLRTAIELSRVAAWARILEWLVSGLPAPDSTPGVAAASPAGLQPA